MSKKKIGEIGRKRIVTGPKSNVMPGEIHADDFFKNNNNDTPNEESLIVDSFDKCYQPNAFEQESFNPSKLTKILSIKPKATQINPTPSPVKITPSMELPVFVLTSGSVTIGITYISDANMLACLLIEDLESEPTVIPLYINGNLQPDGAEIFQKKISESEIYYLGEASNNFGRQNFYWAKWYSQFFDLQCLNAQKVTKLNYGINIYMKRPSPEDIELYNLSLFDLRRFCCICRQNEDNLTPSFDLNNEFEAVGCLLWVVYNQSNDESYLRNFYDFVHPDLIEKYRITEEEFFSSAPLV